MAQTWKTVDLKTLTERINNVKTVDLKTLTERINNVKTVDLKTPPVNTDPQREISRAEVYEELGIAYHSLGLSITATIEQAHQKYRELAKEWHPDVNPHPQAAQKFMEVKQAYETILELNQQMA